MAFLKFLGTLALKLLGFFKMVTLQTFSISAGRANLIYLLRGATL